MKNLLKDKTIYQTKQLYEDAPYPNSKIQSKELIVNGGKNYCKGLGFDPKEMKGKNVLVAGCGTGEHAIGMALSFKPKKIIGIDLSEASLSLGKKYKKNFGVENIDFIQGDIFKLPFNKEQFDYVICEGVLHHTPNPEKGFKCLAEVTKEGGIIVVGIYSVTGRLKQRFQRIIVDLMSKNNADKEKIAKKMYGQNISKEEIYDSYLNPIIKHYFIGDLINWFKKNNFKYIGSYYPFEIGRTLKAIISKIKKQEYAQKITLNGNPSIFDLIIIQLLWLITNQTMIRAAAVKQGK